MSEMQLLQEIRDALKAQREEMTQMRRQLMASDPLKETYTLRELWLLAGGETLCGYETFRQDRRVRALVRGHRHSQPIVTREDAAAYLRSFDTTTPKPRGAVKRRIA